MTDRLYQEQAENYLVDEIVLKSQYNSGIYILPPGGGKTHIICRSIRRLLDLGYSVAVGSDRIGISEQISERLNLFNIDHGKIMSGQKETSDKCQVFTIGCLYNRLYKYKFDVIIIDEAHHTQANRYLELIDHFPGVNVLGLTATPCRLDGKHLGNTYQSMYKGPGFDELMEMGFLSKYRVWSPTIPDLTGIPTSKGDYAPGKVAELLDKSKLVGDMIYHYNKICPGVPAMGFAVNKQSALQYAKEFTEAGIPSEAVLSDTKKEDRKQIIRDFALGKIKVLWSVNVFTEGFDLETAAGMEANVGCVILARPTKSLQIHIQTVGRALRPFKGKEHAFVIDHAGNFVRFGFIEDYHDEWSLEKDIKNKKLKRIDDDIVIRRCPECLMVHRPANVCPHCGHEHGPTQREIERIQAELEELERQKKRKKQKQEQAMAKTLPDLIKLGKERGYKNPAFWAKKIINNRKST